MKQLFFFVTLLLITRAVYSQSEKTADSKITNVTVFLNRAQITREVKASIDAGKTNVVLTGLTSQLDPESIQVAGKSNVIILGISHRQNFLKELTIPKPLKTIKDSVVHLQQQLLLEESQKEILSKEEGMLLSNQKIGGTNQNLTVAELRSMADFYRSRLSDIVTMKLREDEKIKKINERIDKLQLQINSENELYARNTSEIVISLSTDVATTVALEVNYLVSAAGWNAVYDLRAINTKSPIRLNYKANVFQSTGEDWKNIRLKLSTANPSESGLKPDLSPWYLTFLEPDYNPKGKQYKFALRAMPAASVAMDKEEASKSTAEFVSTIQTSLNTEFDISLPYTVASSAKPTLVDIRSYEMKADYIYSVAPKLEPDAFLLARATGWEDYSLLPGESNIFFEGTFVGKSYIDPNSVKDTLLISLGRDKRISVKREKLKELSSRKFIGTNQRESVAWQITVKNNKAEAIKINVEDQIPVSQDAQIEVTLTEMGAAKYEKDNGKLSWDLDLQPNESKKLIFKYDVKYPKGKPINGL